MRKAILLILLFIAFSIPVNADDTLSLFAKMNPYIIGEQGVAVAGSNCGSTGEFDENFDDTGYCNAHTECVGDSCDAGGTNVINEDDSSPAEGTYSLLIDINDATDDAYTYSTAITEHASGTMYYKFSIYIPDDFGAAWAWITLISLQDGDVTPISDQAIRVYAQDQGGAAPVINFRVRGGSAQTSTVTGWGEWLTFRLKVDDDAQNNGAEWCVNTTTQTTATGNVDLDVDRVFFGPDEGVAGTTLEFNIDTFIQSTSDDVGWAGCS